MPPDFTNSKPRHETGKRENGTTAMSFPVGG